MRNFAAFLFLTMRQLKINKSITNRSSAALDKYLVEIGREGLISTDEEVELAQRIHKGDAEALEKLGDENNQVEGAYLKALEINPNSAIAFKKYSSPFSKLFNL